MASLAQLPELVGFFSYSREDDEAFRGSLSALRDAIQRELSAQLGRTRRNFRLWQDQEAIAPGKDWEAEITKAVEQSVFFIPIVTPRAVGSDYCKFEFASFGARESALGRGDIVFPILWISVPALLDETQWRADPVLSIVAKRQYVDWRPLRHAAVDSPAFGQAIERFCGKIVETLREPWLSPEERRQLEAEAKRRAEDEARVRQEAEARRQAEERERLREEALAKKQAEREAREREEAERQRQESEAKKRAEEEERAREEAEAKRRAEEEGAKRRHEEAEKQRRPAEERGATTAASWHTEAPLQIGPAQNMAGVSSGKNWRGVSAVAGLALFGVAVAFLAERGNRQVNTPVVESNPRTPPPSNAVTSAPAAPPASASTAQIQASAPAPVSPPTEAAADSKDKSMTSGSALTTSQERALKAGDSFKECADCPEMIVVPAGRFLMGSPGGQGSDAERPAHDVTIAKPFAVAKFALSFDEWDACAAHGDCATNVGDEGWGRGRRPAINVSWDDAQAYVKWLSSVTGKQYRLLSEAENEYAARAGTETQYPWGDKIKLNGKPMANCAGCGSQWDNEQTAPVGSFPANAFGVYDMVGNVWEWTEDCWNESYQGAPADGSAWTSGDCNTRVVRGSSWVDHDYTGSLRSANHSSDNAGLRVTFLGFRVARTLTP